MRLEPWALSMLGKYSTTELHPQPLKCLFEIRVSLIFWGWPPTDFTPSTSPIAGLQDSQSQCQTDLWLFFCTLIFTFCAAPAVLYNRRIYPLIYCSPHFFYVLGAYNLTLLFTTESLLLRPCKYLLSECVTPETASCSESLLQVDGERIWSSHFGGLLSRAVACQIHQWSELRNLHGHGPGSSSGLFLYLQNSSLSL